MDLIRRISLWLSRLLLQTEILAWISITVLVVVFGTPGPLKRAFHNADLYNRLPDAVMQAPKQSESSANAALDDPAVRESIKNTFPPQKLEGYMNNFMGGLYDWLSGKTPTIDFRIDVSQEKIAIAESIASRAAERLAGLPPCTSLPEGPVDPFTIECLPPGVDITREKKRMANEVLASQEFLPNTIITADQFSKDANSPSFDKSYKDLPNAFQLIKKLPVFLGLLALATSGLVIWLHADKRRGLRNVGRQILANGSFVFVTALLFGVIVPKVFPAMQIRFQTAGASSLMNDVTGQLIWMVITAVLKVSGTLVLLGGTILLGERYIKPRKEVLQPAAPVEENVPPADMKKDDPANLVK